MAKITLSADTSTRRTHELTDTEKRVLTGGGSSSSGSSRNSSRSTGGDATLEDGTPYWLNTQESMGGITPSDPNQAINDYYEKMLKEQQGAIDAQTQAALERNKSYMYDTNEYSDQRLQDAYIASTKARYSLPQTLATQGITGGGAETSALKLETGYQNNRNNIEKDRASTLKSLYQNANDIQTQGNANLADLSAQYYQNMISKSQADANTYKSDYADTIGAYSNDYQAQINKLLAAGYPADSYEIKTLQSARNNKLAGMAQQNSEDEQQAFENYLKQTQLNYNVNKPYYKSSSGGGTSSSYNGLTAAQALSAYNSYMRTPQVIEAVKYFYGGLPPEE